MQQVERRRRTNSTTTIINSVYDSRAFVQRYIISSFIFFSRCYCVYTLWACWRYLATQRDNKRRFFNFYVSFPETLRNENVCFFKNQNQVELVKKAKKKREFLLQCRADLSLGRCMMIFDAVNQWIKYFRWKHTKTIMLSQNYFPIRI